MAYAECRAQLAGRRWNCSGVGDDARLGHVLPMGTKEAAFTYAITSAGVTHALGAACARGDLPSCSCGGGRRRASAAEQWEWGGCGGGGPSGGEAAWGARFARRFLDARELEADARALMNLHNNRVGRKVVKEMVRRECKCHGVSGSCAVRTCWRALPAFPAVAAALADKYRRARLVAAVAAAATATAGAGAAARGRAGPLYAPPLAQPVAPTQGLLLRRGGGGTGRAPRRSELVYLQPSPSYCEPSAAAAAPGTRGRHCQPGPGTAPPHWRSYVAPAALALVLQPSATAATASPAPVLLPRTGGPTSHPRPSPSYCSPPPRPPLPARPRYCSPALAVLRRTRGPRPRTAALRHGRHCQPGPGTAPPALAVLRRTRGPRPRTAALRHGRHCQPGPGTAPPHWRSYVAPAALALVLQPSATAATASPAPVLLPRTGGPTSHPRPSPSYCSPPPRPPLPARPRYCSPALAVLRRTRGPRPRTAALRHGRHCQPGPGTAPPHWRSYVAPAALALVLQPSATAATASPAPVLLPRTGGPTSHPRPSPSYCSPPPRPPLPARPRYCSPALAVLRRTRGPRPRTAALRHGRHCQPGPGTAPPHWRSYVAPAALALVLQPSATAATASPAPVLLPRTGGPTSHPRPSPSYCSPPPRPPLPARPRYCSPALAVLRRTRGPRPRTAALRHGRPCQPGPGTAPPHWRSYVAPAALALVLQPSATAAPASPAPVLLPRTGGPTSHPRPSPSYCSPPPRPPLPARPRYCSPALAVLRRTRGPRPRTAALRHGRHCQPGPGTAPPHWRSYVAPAALALVLQPSATAATASPAPVLLPRTGGPTSHPRPSPSYCSPPPRPPLPARPRYCSPALAVLRRTRGPRPRTAALRHGRHCQPGPGTAPPHWRSYVAPAALALVLQPSATAATASPAPVLLPRTGGPTSHPRPSPSYCSPPPRPPLPARPRYCSPALAVLRRTRGPRPRTAALRHGRHCQPGPGTAPPHWRSYVAPAALALVLQPSATAATASPAPVLLPRTGGPTSHPRPSPSYCSPPPRPPLPARPRYCSPALAVLRRTRGPRPRTAALRHGRHCQPGPGTAPPHWRSYVAPAALALVLQPSATAATASPAPVLLPRTGGPTSHPRPSPSYCSPPPRPPLPARPRYCSPALAVLRRTRGPRPRTAALRHGRHCQPGPCLQCYFTLL
ncbi:hypothetical protein ACJJTC_004234 [Scirpophaga incertulas]